MAGAPAHAPLAAAATANTNTDLNTADASSFDAEEFGGALRKSFRARLW